MIKAIIVEDSELAQIELKKMLSKIDSLEVLAIADNGKDAIQLINKLSPDLIFLDIHLPDMDGFEVLNTINSIPNVIFTTAYDDYAIKSFEYNTLDYLLKPIKFERLENAISKVKKEDQSLLTLQNSFFIKDSDKCFIVKLKDVILFETEGNYTKVFFEDKSPLLHKSLNQIEARLNEDFFFRINRQQVVNVNHIKSVEFWFKGKLKLTLLNNQEVEVSERKSVEMKRRLSI